MCSFEQLSYRKKSLGAPVRTFGVPDEEILVRFPLLGTIEHVNIWTKLRLNWSGNVSKPRHANNGLQNLFHSFCICRLEIQVTITNCLCCL